MSDDRFIKHPSLPFAECRYSENSSHHYKPHIHKGFSIGAIDKGEVDFLIEGQSVTLVPGSLALVNPDTIHACNPNKHNRRSYYMLHLDIEWCLQLQQSLWHLDTFQPVSSPLLEDRTIYDQFTRTMASFMEPANLLEKEETLIELVETVFTSACKPLQKIESPPLQIKKLKRMLSENLDQDLALNGIAREMNVNPYTLLRQFKAAEHITPHAFRLNCRIDHARKLLQNGMDISQVALESGFFDQSHFHRHFKAVTTVTPGAYQLNFIQ